MVSRAGGQVNGDGWPEERSYEWRREKPDDKQRQGQAPERPARPFDDRMRLRRMHVDDVPNAVGLVSIVVVEVPVVDQEVVIRVHMGVQRPDRRQDGTDGQQGTNNDEDAAHRRTSLRWHWCGAKEPELADTGGIECPLARVISGIVNSIRAAWAVRAPVSASLGQWVVATHSAFS